MLTTYKEQLDIPAEMSGSLRFRKTVSAMPGPHRHDELEVNLVVGGTATYLIGNSRYDLRQHSMTWFFPEQDHVLINQSHGFCMWLGIFKRSLVEQICTEPATQTLLSQNPPGHFCRELHSPEAERLCRLFADITYVDGSSPPAPASLLNIALGYVLLASWCKFLAADDLPAGSHIHPGVEHAARIVRDEGGSGEDALSVEGIAKQVGLSPAYLSRLFLQQTGITLAQMRNKQRVSRFLEIYGKGHGSTMLEAALESGFGSYAQFHRVFVEIMGCNPAEYRRRISA